jgi:peptidoglycan/LPS O-acetylase OafA/YrhL
MGSKKPMAIDSLTTLRGLAAAWVTVFHFSGDLYSLFPWTKVLDPFLLHGWLAVPLFFILSGFVLYYNYGSSFRVIRTSTYGRFLAMRLGRIYPVHLATLFAALAVYLAARSKGIPLAEEAYSARTFWLNVFLVQTWVPDFGFSWNRPSWSISTEWFAYLWFPFAAFLIERVGRRLWLGVGIVLFSLATLAVNHFHTPCPFLLNVIPTFLCGCLIARWYAVSGPTINRQGCRVATLCLFAIIACSFVLPDSFSKGVFLIGFTVIIFALAGAGETPSRIWTAPSLLFLGEVSYSLYMTHMLVGMVLGRLVDPTRFEDAALGHRLGIAVLYLAAVILATLACYYLVERPARRYFRWLLGAPVRSPETRTAVARLQTVEQA